MALIIPQKKSALDLQIPGSVGEFSVGVQGKNSSSLQVKYIQTHITLDVNGSHEERLLSALRPVREVYKPEKLEFDEIMQRDIDDARVSLELIPYLLNQRNAGLVKFFPPIIIVVLPTKSGMPIDRYPEVTLESTATDQGFSWLSWRSGRLGEEAFEFRQMEVDGKAQAHTHAELNLNTRSTSLVIVDGQHRAMALLALYRNLVKWPEGTRAWEYYYKRWTPRYLEQFDLGRVQLPVLICTFPELHEGKGGIQGVKVSNACRSIFLALNKNARPVSKARNFLVDDYDIIAHFLRDTLSQIKQFDANSPEALRLWNVELDTDADRQALSSATAITGVMHLYPLIEHLLLDDRIIRGVSAARANTYLIKNLSKKCIRVLQAQEELGEDLAKNLNRYAVPREAMEVLVNRYHQRYGELIVRGLASFGPYKVHNEVALELEVDLRARPQAHAILFEGQGVARVFEEYIEGLEKSLKETSPPPGELTALAKQFKSTQKDVEEQVREFRRNRARKLLHDKEYSKNVMDTVDRFYADTLTTAAFQMAFLATFFSVVEGFSDEVKKETETSISDDEVGRLFDEYLSSINQFFRPKNRAETEHLLSTFCGRTEGAGAEMIVLPFKHDLRHILIPGELKPDYWVRFRYVFLELWRPDAVTSAKLEQRLEKERQFGRTQVLRFFVERELIGYLEQHGMERKSLDEVKQKEIEESCIQSFAVALEHLKVKAAKRSIKYLEGLLHTKGSSTGALVDDLEED